MSDTLAYVPHRTLISTRRISKKAAPETMQTNKMATITCWTIAMARMAAPHNSRMNPTATARGPVRIANNAKTVAAARLGQ